MKYHVTTNTYYTCYNLSKKELSEQLNYKDIINDFPSKKARKIKEL